MKAELLELCNRLGNVLDDISYSSGLDEDDETMKALMSIELDLRSLAAGCSK